MTFLALTVKNYHKIGFCEAKGFINFAFCILNFAFAVYRSQTDKLQIAKQKDGITPVLYARIRFWGTPQRETLVTTVTGL